MKKFKQTLLFFILSFSFLFPSFQIARLIFGLPIPNHIFFLPLLFIIQKDFHKIKFNRHILFGIAFLFIFYLFLSVYAPRFGNLQIILYLLTFLFSCVVASAINYLELYFFLRVLLIFNIIYVFIQFILLYSFDYNLMMHSNVNEGYSISSHSYLSIILGWKNYRLTGLVNENGPFCCFLLLICYVLHANRESQKFSTWFIFWISFLFTLLSGSKVIIFFLLFFIFLVIKNIYLRTIIVFLPAIYMLVALEFDEIIRLLDVQRRIQDFMDAELSFYDFGIGFQSSTNISILDKVPQDFISYNSLGIGFIPTILLFLFLLKFMFSQKKNIYIFIPMAALLTSAGSLSSFLWAFFILVVLLETKTKKNECNYE